MNPLATRQAKARLTALRLRLRPCFRSVLRIFRVGSRWRAAPSTSSTSCSQEDSSDRDNGVADQGEAEFWSATLLQRALMIVYLHPVPFRGNLVQDCATEGPLQSSRANLV